MYKHATGLARKQPDRAGLWAGGVNARSGGSTDRLYKERKSWPLHWVTLLVVETLKAGLPLNFPGFKFFSKLVIVLGTLHVGDEIREINGMSVLGQTVETLQKMLVSYFINGD